MKKDEALYYVALMGGLIVGSVTMRLLGFTGIVQLIVAVICGIGFGYLAQRAIDKRKLQDEQQQSLQSGFEPDAGPCPICGGPRIGLHCNRCRRETGPYAPPPPANQPWK